MATYNDDYEEFVTIRTTTTTFLLALVTTKRMMITNKTLNYFMAGDKKGSRQNKVKENVTKKISERNITGTDSKHHELIRSRCKLSLFTG